MHEKMDGLMNVEIDGGVTDYCTLPFHAQRKIKKWMDE